MKCKLCEKEFRPKNNKQIYCSQECQRKNDCIKQKEKSGNKKAICPVCEEVFKKESARQKYCSEYCRISNKKPEVNPVRKRRKDNISHIEEEARKAGMTYGQYQALKIMETTRVELG